MKNGIINFEINTKICYKDKVFILNKPFESSYTDVEGNIAHEIIDYIKIDINKVFVYNNHWSHCPDFRKAEIELEIEAEMKDKYEFVEYSKICRFIDDVNKKNYFKGFPFEERTFKTLLMHLTSLVIKINQNSLNNSFWNRYKKLSPKLS